MTPNKGYQVSYRGYLEMTPRRDSKHKCVGCENTHTSQVCRV